MQALADFQTQLLPSTPASSGNKRHITAAMRWRLRWRRACACPCNRTTRQYKLYGAHRRRTRMVQVRECASVRKFLSRSLRNHRRIRCRCIASIYRRCSRRRRRSTRKPAAAHMHLNELSGLCYVCFAAKFKLVCNTRARAL